MNTKNTRGILAKLPDQVATPDCFSIVEDELTPLQPGQLRVAVEYLSVVAGTRTMLVGEGFHQQVGIGDTILAGVYDLQDCRRRGGRATLCQRGP